ncbi:hypothetical protein ACI1UG_02730 [Lactococcus garvieae]|uniref:hypothetical protein n=1 Tax=Lactococcus garvieae TaxID=1363 RepID=UPI003853FFA9
MDFEGFKRMAQRDVNKSICYELEDDNSRLVKDIYTNVFPFYDESNFSGDVIFTWKSASLTVNGVYKPREGRNRDPEVTNNHFIGNLFPNFMTDEKYSLNTNRNGYMGDFPHDHIDIYLMHIAKYAFSDKSDFVNSRIKEYYPLKRAILFKDNLNYLKSFKTFDNFLKMHYFEEIWDYIQNKKCFSDMEYEEFKKESLVLIEKRGKAMIRKMLETRI